MFNEQVQQREQEPSQEQEEGSVVTFDRHRMDDELEMRFGEAYRQFSQNLRECLRLQEEIQKTREDEEICVQMADQLNENARHFNPKHALNKEQLETVKTATRITDIGKMGPAESTGTQRRLIGSMYAIETSFPKQQHLMTMREFLTLAEGDENAPRVPYIADHLEERMAELKEMGLAQLNVRQFLDLHATWSWELIKNEKALSKEARVCAALHHLLEGNNPDGLIDLSSDALWIPSLNRPVGKEEMMVILLDKYQARRRFADPKLGRLRTHDEQIAWMKNFLTEPWGVQLKPYPDWLREQLLDYVEILNQAGPFPHYFEMDKLATHKPTTDELFGAAAK